MAHRPVLNPPGTTTPLLSLDSQPRRVHPPPYTLPEPRKKNKKVVAPKYCERGRAWKWLTLDPNLIKLPIGVVQRYGATPESLYAQPFTGWTVEPPRPASLPTTTNSDMPQLKIDHGLAVLPSREYDGSNRAISTYSVPGKSSLETVFASNNESPNIDLWIPSPDIDWSSLTYQAAGLLGLPLDQSGYIAASGVSCGDSAVFTSSHPCADDFVPFDRKDRLDPRSDTTFPAEHGSIAASQPVQWCCDTSLICNLDQECMLGPRATISDPTTKLSLYSKDPLGGPSISTIPQQRYLHEATIASYASAVPQESPSRNSANVGGQSWRLPPLDLSPTTAVEAVQESPFQQAFPANE